MVSVVQLSSFDHGTIQFLYFVCDVGRLRWFYRTALWYAADNAQLFGSTRGHAADALHISGMAVGAAGI